MYKLSKKMLAMFAGLVCTLAMTVSVFATDMVREDGFSSKDGLEISIATDSDTYKEGEAIKYTITVKNTNNYALDDVFLEYRLPDGIEYDKAELNKIKSIGVMQPGETKEFVFATAGEEHSELNLALVIGIVAGVVAVVVIIIVVVLLLKKKKKNATAMMLVGTMIAGGMTAGISGDAMAVTNSDFKSVSVHDPSIVKDPESGTYYIFGSHLAFAKTDDLMKWSNVNLNLKSEYNELFGDVWNNYCITDANKVMYSNTGSNLWAPDIIWNDTMKKWCMYMSVNGNDWHSAIVLLTADDIEGPYEYVDEVVFSGYDGSASGEVVKSIMKASKVVDYNGTDAELVISATFQEYSETLTRAQYSDIKKVLELDEDDIIPARYNTTDQSKVNAIDPAVTYDEDGNLWMTYGSWSAGIYQIKLDNKTGLRDYDYKEYGDYVKDKCDPYLGYKIAGGYYNSGEGPYVLHAGDYYYLFISLGNLEASGGYNMRMFRSENINGPYVDMDGNSAIYKSFNSAAGFIDLKKDTKTTKYNAKNGLRVMSSITMYGKSSTHVEVAQGHNSAMVDEDGKIYLVYHSRFSDSGEGHSVKVHQMYVNEDGWLVVSPYEYSGETLSTTAYPATEIAGTYDLSIQYQEKVYVATSSDSTKGIYKAKSIQLTADGKITGDVTGTWKLTKGNNAELVLDGETYKGVFVKQANETDRKETLVFTVCGDNQMAWGAKTK